MRENTYSGSGEERADLRNVADDLELDDNTKLAGIVRKPNANVTYPNTAGHCASTLSDSELANGRDSVDIANQRRM